MLQQNQQAPDFCIADQNNQPVQLTDFRQRKQVVLYFYPKDDTPGCTIEANEFTALASEFAARDTVVIGVSKDSCDSHRQFIDKYNLQLILLADTRGECCAAYGVWQEKEKNGERKMGIVRSTFLIDKNGIIQQALYGVSAAGHAREILDTISNWQTNPSHSSSSR